MPSAINKQDVVRAYLDKFPKAATTTLASKAYREHPALWPTRDACRCAFRYARGATGEKHRRQVKDKRHLRLPQQAVSPFAKLPEGWKEISDYKPVQFDGPCKVLVLPDIHMPYQETVALDIALQTGLESKADTILLLGDTIDCFALSQWQTDPRERKFEHEVLCLRSLFELLREHYLKARLVWKWGNHEERWERYMQCKAPELLDIDDFDFASIVRAPQYEVEVIRDRVPLRFGKLFAIHGHEYRGSISNPVNPARGLYLRSKVNAICAHFHQSSHHSETAMDGKLTSCWSLGCLCDLHPRYMPLNKWSHGFALIDVDANGAFSVENKRIIDGKVW